jgi:Flagellar motor protein
MNEYGSTIGDEADSQIGISARRKKATPPAAAAGSWLTTFADMVTLLLTFLVLLISITTMDPRSTRLLSEGLVSEETRQEIWSDGVLHFSDWGLLAPVVELIENIDRLPEDVMFDQREIKNAVFQLDPAKTPNYEQLQEAAEEGVEIFRDNRGLVVRWDRSLLFPEGGTTMFDENLMLLQKMAGLLSALELPVSIEGHTNPLSPLEGATGPVSYELSMRRSKVVMEYLVSLGLPERRFRIGGHGGAQPRTNDPDLAWENSRLEIVIYKPEASSITGR